MSQNPAQRVSSFGRGFSFESISITAAAKSLTVPAGAKSAMVSTDAVTLRFRTDGIAPTSTIGHQLPVDTFMEFFGDDMDYVQFISTGATTTLFVTYYN